MYHSVGLCWKIQHQRGKRTTVLNTCAEININYQGNVLNETPNGTRYNLRHQWMVQDITRDVVPDITFEKTTRVEEGAFDMGN